MPTAYILLGTNLGNRIQNLDAAILHIGNNCGVITQKSAIYETAPWGNFVQDNFLNQVIALHTFIEPTMLMKQLLNIESFIGRVRTVKYGPRIIDIDILLIGDQIIHNETLILPHPELQNRRFVLVPLAEIAGETVHPTLHSTITQLLEICTDHGHVQKF